MRLTTCLIRQTRQGLRLCRARETAALPCELRRQNCASSRKSNGLALSLNVVVKSEFVRMRPQAHCIGFALALIFRVGFDQILRENVTLNEKAVILLETGQCFIE